VRFFNLICILNTFFREPLSGLIPELFLGNFLSSPSTPVLAYPLAGIRNYRWQVTQYEHRGAGDSTSRKPGRDRGSRQRVRELACCDRLRRRDQSRSDFSWKFVALQVHWGTKLFGCTRVRSAPLWHYPRTSIFRYTGSRFRPFTDQP
jgi:hypothetical protein